MVITRNTMDDEDEFDEDENESLDPYWDEDDEDD